MFLWLALHNRLITNIVRAKRGLTNDPLCPICELEYEDAEHGLQCCLEAQTVWAHVFDNRMGTRGDNLCFREWVEVNAKAITHRENWYMKFIITAWYLWKW